MQRDYSERRQFEHVHIIDLAGIRRGCGVVWEKIRDAIRYRLQQIVRNAGASCAPLDDTRYAVTAHTDDAESALILTAKAAYDHCFGLFGSCDPRDLEIYRAFPAGENNFATSRVPVDKVVSLFQRPGQEPAAQPALRQIAGAAQFPSSKTRAIPELRGSARTGISITHHFEPVWDAHHEAISSYFCAAKEITAAGKPTERVGILELTSKERATLDYSCFLHGIEHMTLAVEKGNYFLLSVAVSFETLSSPSERANLLRACKGLPFAYRRYLMFVLDDVPNGVTQTRLSDLAMALRPFGRVIASAPSGCRDFNAYENIGLHGIALNLSNPPNDRERIRADIVQLAAAGRKMRFGAAVFGLADRETLLLAQAADVRLLHGPVVVAARAAPRRMTHLGRDVITPQTEQAGDEEWF